MAAENFKVVAEHSKAVFKVTNFFVTKVSGTFSGISGAIIENIENPAESSAEIAIKTESIDTRNGKRDSHLRTPDFFDVHKFPTMSFKSNKVVKLSEGAYRVTGDFNLHGITKPLTVDVKKLSGPDNKSGAGSVFETNFTIARSEFGMTHDARIIGDKVDASLLIVSAKV
jgi:polyisoprenoid-binding protein YceI